MALMGRRREENRKTAVARRQPAAAAAATRRGLLYAPEGLAALAVPDAAAGPEASGTLSNSVDFKPLPLSNSVDFKPLPLSNSLDFKPAGSSEGTSAWAGGAA